MKRLNLVGQRFGRLVVIEEAPRYNGHIHYKCLCDCGTLTYVQTSNLRGKTKSCGCLHKESSKKNSPYKPTHGLSHLREFGVWTAMHQRCSDTNHNSYKNYGGRGIVVCERWKDFENFFADMGLRPGDEYTIERLENNSNYEPLNCIWATRATQQKNRRCSN